MENPNMELPILPNTIEPDHVNSSSDEDTDDYKTYELKSVPVEQEHYSINQIVNGAHRNDIDGIRTLAMVLMFVFHCWPREFPMGVVGVDVFFVVSGYLITDIVCKPDITYSEFYGGRVKRLIPSMLMLVITVVSVSKWMFTITAYRTMLITAATACVGTANIYLLLNDENKSAGYDPDIQPNRDNPFLHLWSLSIVEQFYFVWPMVISKTTKPVYGVLVAVSVTVSIILSYVYVSTAYYNTVTRVWPFLVGSIIYKYPVLHLRTYWNIQIASVIALLLYVLAWLLITTASIQYYPAWYVVLPTVATGLLLMTEGSVVNNILTTAPFPAFGRITYAFYLWHWPIIVLSRIVTNGINLTTNCPSLLDPVQPPYVFVFILTTGIAYISTVTERYIMKSTYNRTGVIFIALTFIATITMFVTHNDNGLEVVHNPTVDLNATEQLDTCITNIEPMAPPWLYPTVNCKSDLGESGPSPNYILWGDSIMVQYTPRILQLDIPVYNAAMCNCPPWPIPAPTHECAAHQLTVLQYIRDQNRSFEIVFAFTTGYKECTYQTWANAMQYFTSRGHVIHLIPLPPVLVTQNAFGCKWPMAGPIYALSYPSARSVQNMQFLLPAEYSRRYVDNIMDATVLSGGYVNDPADTMAYHGKWPVITPQGNPAYVDSIHFSAEHIDNSAGFLLAIFNRPVVHTTMFCV